MATSFKWISAALLFGFACFIRVSSGHAVEDQRFIVQTDEESAAESLNRISGNVDPRGYASPEQTYRSEHHSKPGAFQRSDEITGWQDLSSRY